MKLKFYQLFNLNIQSNIDFPELIVSTDKKFDLFILEEENIALEIQNILDQGDFLGEEIRYKINESHILLEINEVGTFLISNEQISFVRLPEVNDETVRTYLLGSCMGFYLIKKGVFPFHASAVDTNRGTVLFVGESGVGKSTMAGIFLNKGHKILTDDVCMVNISENNELVAFPSLQRIKFWEDSAAKLGYKDSELLTIIPGWEKKQLLLTENSKVNKSKALFTIYELVPSNIENVKIERLFGKEKLLTLLNNIYRVEGVDVLNQLNKHFEFCAKVAKKVTVKRIKRPVGKFDIDSLYTVIMEDLNN